MSCLSRDFPPSMNGSLGGLLAVGTLDYVCIRASCCCIKDSSCVMSEVGAIGAEAVGTRGTVGGVGTGAAGVVERGAGLSQIGG